MKNRLTRKKLVAMLAVALASSSAVHAGGMHGSGHEGMKMGGMNMGGGDSDAGHWMSPESAAAEVNPIADSAESIAKGRAIYQKNCASCHGANADGKGMAGMMLNPKPANLRVMAGQHPDGDFAYKIRTGRGAMPAWGAVLSENEIWNTVNYIQSLKPDDDGDHGQKESGGHGGPGHGH